MFLKDLWPENVCGLSIKNSVVARFLNMGSSCTVCRLSVTRDSLSEGGRILS